MAWSGKVIFRSNAVALRRPDEVRPSTHIRAAIREDLARCVRGKIVMNSVVDRRVSN